MSNLTYLSSADPEVLRQRSELLRQLRSFFHKRDFIEVQTPVLSHDTVVDLHLDPMTAANPDNEPRFLQTSPEFAMKRILASGLKCIFEITPAFRHEESGPRHNPEFTMLEWYRCGDDYLQGRQLLAELIDDLLGQPNWKIESQPCRQVSFAEAFEAATGQHPFLASTKTLADLSIQHGLGPSAFDRIDENLCRREAINFLWAVIVDPNLGIDCPVLIYDWPGSESALAQTRIDQVQGQQIEIAERFELYFRSFELANGYHELLDPSVLRRRIAETNRQRQQLGKTQLPADSQLLDAMDAGLPASCGVALGVDRLLMSLIGAKDITQVIPFPWGRA